MNIKQQAPVYVRFGLIPDNELSGVYDGDLGRVRDEVGVCVYDCTTKQGFYQIILPSISEAAINDLYHYLHDSNSPVFLVAGDYAGTGTYNEPCLKNVTVIGELTKKELQIPCPVNKLDKTNKQLILKK